MPLSSPLGWAGFRATGSLRASWELADNQPPDSEMMTLGVAGFRDDDFRRLMIKSTPRQAPAPLLDPFHKTSCIGVAPLSGEYGTYKTVKARFWPWLSGKSRLNPFKLSPPRSAARLSGAPCAGENAASFIRERLTLAQVAQPPNDPMIGLPSNREICCWATLRF